MPKAGNAPARNDLPLDALLAGDCVEVATGQETTIAVGGTPPRPD